MKVYKIFLFLVSCTPLLLGAQNFQIQDQFGFGTADWDEGYAVLETADGGFLFCSRTDSDVSGDKTTTNFGELDIWIVKTDSDGNIVWQKSYGTFSNDAAFSMTKTADGNYIITGWSWGGISGNKTVPGYGGGDPWLIKIDPTGNILWQKSYGGNGLDSVRKTVEQSNGNYVTGISSGSEISGTKLLPLKGTNDYWLIFYDNNGNFLKELAFGGEKDNYFKDLTVISSNRIILSGLSNSSDSLDKTEPSYGEFDYWVIKSDTNGIVLKDKTIGGSKMDGVTGHVINNENNIIIFGLSESPVSGNKTAPKIGGQDIWLVKLDTNLNIIWDKTFGGILDEEMFLGKAFYSDFHNMSIIAGSSESPKLLDKTTENFGGFDYWIVGVDNQGNKVMEISIGGTEDDFAREVIETTNHQLVVVGRSASGISGNKTIASKGIDDLWVVKLDITLSIDEVEKTTIAAYPIPATTILNFSTPIKGNQVTAEIIDIKGSIILRQTLNNQENGQFNISNLVSGTYFLRITGNNFSYSRTVVIE